MPPHILRYLRSDGRLLSLLRHHRLTMSHLKQIQSNLTASGALSDPSVSAKLVAFCALSPRGDLRHAALVLASLLHPNTFSWNALISAHLQRSRPLASLSLYKIMVSEGFLPNNYTFSFILAACVDLPHMAVEGPMFHSQIIRLGWEEYEFVRNGLIDMYVNCGAVGDARKVFDTSPHRDVVSWTCMISGYMKHGDMDVARRLFDSMPQRNAVSWSVMINGYAQFGMFKEALDMFKEMQIAGVRPNHAGIVGALMASAYLGALDQGRWIHAYVKKNEMPLDRILGTALIDMYSKCGCIETAHKIFDEMPLTDVYAFTSLISGLWNHGHSQKALELFYRMCDEKVSPNEVTFICVLSACSRIGLVDEGKRLFDSMSRLYGIQPGVEHYGCMVDLFGRAGLLDEAKRFVKGMPMRPDSYVLGALLNACRVHGNIELGRETVESLEELGIADGGAHVILSNMYATKNKWQEMAGVRKRMEMKYVRKVPGCSMIEVDGVSFEFVAGDQSRFPLDNLLSVLKQIDKHLKSSHLDEKAEFHYCTSCQIP